MKNYSYFMKRVFNVKMVLLVGALVMNVCVANAQRSQALLMHNGKMTPYLGGQLATALNDAVDGDTIYLTEGTFPGFTLEKRVVIIGEHQGESLKSNISGGITISIPDSITLNGYLLKGLALGGNNITVSKPIDGLEISQCSFNSFSIQAYMHDALIERCIITNTISIPQQFVTNMTIKNSKIKYLASTCGTFTALNCNIHWINDWNGFVGSLINSILSDGSDIAKKFSYNAVITNCLYPTDYYGKNLGTSTNTSCWGRSDLENYGYDVPESIYSQYLGNDGTYVGCYGGSTPFTLNSGTPYVQSYSVVMDNENKRLNVSISATTK